MNKRRTGRRRRASRCGAKRNLSAIGIVMNSNSNNGLDRSPILIVPYMWIGDFVRCHSVVKLLNARYPRASGRYAGDDAMRAARRLHARPAPGHRRRPAAQPSGAERTVRPGKAPQDAKATARRWSCRGRGNRRWRRFLPAFPNGPVSPAKRALSCSTTCASASALCRAWSIAARHWRCRPARNCRRIGRYRSSKCPAQRSRHGAKNGG